MLSLGILGLAPWAAQRESNRDRGIGCKGSQPGTTGVGLSVWKLLLALQGDRDRLTL